MLILGAGRRSSSVRDCFMIIMLVGTRCRWAASALRASAAGGPACAASPGLIVAGVGSCCDWSEAGAGGVPLLLLLLRWRARLVAASVAAYYYIILCRCSAFVNAFTVYAAVAAGLAAGRPDLLQVAKSACFSCFFCKFMLDKNVNSVV